MGWIWRMDDMDDGEHGILGSVLFVMFIYFPTICSKLRKKNAVDGSEILHHLRCIIMG